MHCMKQCRTAFLKPNAAPPSRGLSLEAHNLMTITDCAGVLGYIASYSSHSHSFADVGSQVKVTGHRSLAPTLLVFGLSRTPCQWSVLGADFFTDLPGKSSLFQATVEPEDFYSEEALLVGALVV